MIHLLKRFFSNRTPKSHRNELRAGPFNHCSSVCAHKDGVLIAWYAGSGECQDDQSVYVSFERQGVSTTPLYIGPKTGNPVLIPQRSDKAVLMWSKFEDSGPIRSIVDRWKYCSLWMSYVRLSGEKVTLDGHSVQISEPSQHLLGRCNPIRVKNGFLMPLYDETHAHGVIFKGDELEYKPHGRLGFNMIQPTLWAFSDRIYSLSRNFMTRSHFRARQSYSDDGGVTWSDPVPSRLPNNNSSLHAIDWGQHTLIMWNNTPMPKRRSMTLGFMGAAPYVEDWRINVVDVLDDYGAYPSMCVDRSNNLHMTYTSSARTIIHHTWNHKHYIQMRGKLHG